MSLDIDYEKVESTVSSIKTTVDNGSIISEYDTLISGLSESKGEEAKAIKSMLKKEKKLAEQLNSALSGIADSVQGAVNEFTRIDKEQKGKMGNIG